MATDRQSNDEATAAKLARDDEPDSGTFDGPSSSELAQDNMEIAARRKRFIESERRRLRDA